ncbi:MAG: DUF4331 family protein [Steroidobacteraceae bacterium]
MNSPIRLNAGELLSLLLLSIALGTGAMRECAASNHLDTSVVTANPQANIGDIYAWTAPDGRHLNLVMDVVGRSFSDKLGYVFYIDSGPRFGKTTATRTIVCRFPDVNVTDCRLGRIDRARGDAGVLAGLEGRKHRFRVFAGLRDDPFFNNVKGTRAAQQVAFAALKAGAPVDRASCPMFDQATARSVLYQWRHTDGGPATNFLAHWTTSALVISVDIGAVDRGGSMLAVWAATESSARRWDRLGRPLSKNALIGLTDPNGVGDKLEDQWNRLTPATSGAFVADMEKSLAFYDGLDGVCGNQILAAGKVHSVRRYRPLAALLTDDRLWVNAASRKCTQFFAVELANLAGRKDLRGDCGGRTPLYDASNVWRSLLVQGGTSGTDDGLHEDEHVPSSTKFPFLAPPDEQAIYH